MAGERLVRILAMLSSDGTGGSTGLCSVAAAITELPGAGIMLISAERQTGSLCVSDDVSALIEEAHYTMGEGPGLDAHRSHAPVVEPDLAHPLTSRWVAFTPPVIDAGVRAVFAFPVQVGAVRLGALNLYRDRPGALSRDQHADALVMADVVARSLLDMQTGMSSDVLATEFVAGTNFHLAVHQASGMVAAQLDVTIGEALLRLRAHAFAHDQALTDTAAAVVERELRFDGRDGDGTECVRQ